MKLKKKLHLKTDIKYSEFFRKVNFVVKYYMSDGFSIYCCDIIGILFPR